MCIIVTLIKYFMLYNIVNNKNKPSLPNLLHYFRADKPCADDEYQCIDKKCISRDHICDNNYDCSAGEDEELCDLPGSDIDDGEPNNIMFY